MSITANDHRKYLDVKAAEEAARAVEKAMPPLVQQAESAAATTGDDRLDKLVRGIQDMINKLEESLPQIAAKGMGAIPADMMKLVQMDYMHTHGKLVALQEIIKLPAQIMLEERPAPTKLTSV
jgi:hypothetical protein